MSHLFGCRNNHKKKRKREERKDLKSQYEPLFSTLSSFISHDKEERDKKKKEQPKSSMYNLP